MVLYDIKLFFQKILFSKKLQFVLSPDMSPVGVVSKRGEYNQFSACVGPPLIQTVSLMAGSLRSGTPVPHSQGVWGLAPILGSDLPSRPYFRKQSLGMQHNEAK